MLNMKMPEVCSFPSTLLIRVGLKKKIELQKNKSKCLKPSFLNILEYRF